LGFGAILPGISSGVFCVAFGIYEKLVDSMLGFFKDIKKNSRFLFPILFGAFVGVLVFSNILKVLFANFYVPTSFAFMGLILGTLPLVWKQAVGAYGIRPCSEEGRIPYAPTISHIMCLLLALSFSIYLAALDSSPIGHLGNNLETYSVRLFVFSWFYNVCWFGNTWY